MKELAFDDLQLFARVAELGTLSAVAALMAAYGPVKA